MKILFKLVILIFISSGFSYGQTTWQTPFERERTYDTYNDCAAIFFDDEMLVDDYSPRGVCKLQSGQRGEIYVATVKLTDGGGGYAMEKIPFQIAIKNNRTNTLRMFSAKVYESVQFEDILQQCEEGDEIVILTTDNQYSLSHHIIQLSMGC